MDVELLRIRVQSAEQFRKQRQGILEVLQALVERQDRLLCVRKIVKHVADLVEAEQVRDWQIGVEPRVDLAVARVYVPVPDAEVRAERDHVRFVDVVPVLQRARNRGIRYGAPLRGNVCREIEDPLVALFRVSELGAEHIDVYSASIVEVVLHRAAVRFVAAIDEVVSEVEEHRYQVTLGAGVLHLAVVGDLLSQVVRGVDQEAEPVVGIGYACVAAVYAAPTEILLPDAVLGRSRPAPHIRWPERLDVDVAGNGLARHVGRDGFVGHDLARDDGGIGVESGDPAVLDTGNVDAVEGRRGVALRRSPKADVARLPLVAFDREPGESAQRIREVLVREAADRIGRNDVRDVVRVAFGFDRGDLARPDRLRDDHHFFQFFGVRWYQTDGGE